MFTRNKNCPACGHKNLSIAKHCGGEKCKYQFRNPKQGMALAIPHNNQQLVSRATTQAIPIYNSNPLMNVAHDLDTMRFQLMQIKDELQRGSFLWHPFGRYFYRRDIGKQIDAIFKWIEANWQNTYYHFHEQHAAFMLSWQQQQYDHQYQYAEFEFQERLKNEKIRNLILRLVAASDLLTQLFIDEGRFDLLDSEEKVVQLLRILTRIENLILEETSYIDNDNPPSDVLDYLEV